MSLSSCNKNKGNSNSSESSSGDSSSSSIPVINEYTITFIDESGNILDSKKWDEGSIPSYTYEPVSSKEWKKTFLGWSTSISGSILEELPPVSGDTTYYAIVNEEKNKYTITFDSLGGSEVTSITDDYGTLVEKPDDPSKLDYEFVKWTFDKEGTQEVTWPYKIIDDVIFFANYKEKIDVKAHFSMMLEEYTSNPYEYVPESMRPEFAGNIKQEEDLNKDYTEFQQVSEIAFGGQGQQWNMVLDNLKQSETYKNVLETGKEIIADANTKVIDWLDSKPSDISSHIFDETKYKAKITYVNKVLKYTVQFKSGWNVPVLGDVLPQIDMSVDIATGVNIFRIQLNNNNVIKYVVSDNYYAYGMNLDVMIDSYVGSKKGYYEISKDITTNVITGHMYEFIKYEVDEETITLKSSSDFYINDTYVSVIGNKTNNSVLSENYVSELYELSTGHLLVYKIEETYEKWGANKTYNTLFFNLNNIDNINKVKLVENTNTDLHENNHDVYVNDKESLFVATRNEVKQESETIKASRRYDIEMRKQYFYTLDEQEKPVKHEVLTPMMFIQDDGTEPGETNYSTFETDILTDNYIQGKVNLSDDHLTKVRQDYSNLIPVFKENKDEQTSDTVIEFIGDPEII